MKPIRVCVIGAGLIGERRAGIAATDRNTKLVAISDTRRKIADRIAGRLGCESVEDGMALARRKDIDAVIVATPHQFLPVYSLAAIRAGKHVLCEKPMGRNLAEVEKMVMAAKKYKTVLKPGFNHRHHPAIRKALETATRGEIGKIFLMRCRYGHGGRPGYEREWRGNQKLAGGGELLDQGIHAVDLFRQFAGDFTEVFGWTSTQVWDIAPLEDNALALLKTANGVTASLHASWTQWKNLFSFEIFGREGYLIVEGLGGSYGTERLIIGRRKPKSGPPVERLIIYPGHDLSWRKEWTEFMRMVAGRRLPRETLHGEDGLEAIRLVDAIYRSSRQKRPVRVLRTHSPATRRAKR